MVFTKIIQRCKGKLSSTCENYLHICFSWDPKIASVDVKNTHVILKNSDLIC